MAFPDDLLAQAQLLAKIDKNRPRQASLRRAVSTAYYALFHLLTTAAVANWKRPRQRHASVRDLKTIANTFIQLRQYRNHADYDNSKKWTRTEVLAHIELALLAFVSWDAIRSEAVAEDFLLQLLINR